MPSLSSIYHIYFYNKFFFIRHNISLQTASAQRSPNSINHNGLASPVHTRDNSYGLLFLGRNIIRGKL